MLEYEKNIHIFKKENVYLKYVTCNILRQHDILLVTLHSNNLHSNQTKFVELDHK